MDKVLIEFFAARPDLVPHPYPARQEIPDWLKQMPGDLPAESVPGATKAVPTLKRCAPFLDALSCGYVIPLAGDVRFTREPSGQLHFESQGKLIESQFPPQYAGAPFAGGIVVKFTNPWLVRTPPGYSALVLPPLNRFHLPFHILGGVVETDRYFREIHFPSICLMQPGTSAFLPRGSPLVQVVPFRRESWRSECGAVDLEKRIDYEKRFSANTHLYKEQDWVRKEFD